MSNPHGHEPKVGTGQGTTGSQRGVRSTRTPATRTPREPEHQHAHRSQTLPTPAPVSTTRRTPIPQMTMPTPTTTTSSRQRTPSFPKALPKKSPSPVPEPSKPKTSLDGTGYIVEPLQPTFRSESREGREPQSHVTSPMSIPTPQPTFRSESREGRREPQTHIPPPTSIPISKPTLDSTRQSVSSFQTEPSSYYSAAEDAGSARGTPIPPPQMPQPSHTEPETQLSRYEALWLASQADEAPPMPVPELAPPMPSARVGFEPSSYDDMENEADFEDEYQEDVEESGTDEYGQHVDARGQEDQPQRSWSARPPPGLPVSTSGHSRTSSASTHMPVPSTGRDYAQPTHGSTPVHYPQASHGTIPEPRPTETISSTAPLRIHHTQRPSGVAPPSPGLPQPRPSPVPSPTNQYASQHQPIPSRINSQQQPQNTPPGSGFSVTSRPQNERPSGNQSSTISPSQTHHKTGSGSSYEGRPPGASAPSIPSGTNTSIYHNPPSKQYTGQTSTVRPNKTQVTGGPASTSPTSSSFSPSNQAAVSTHPTTATAPSPSSTPPSKPTPPSSTVTHSYPNTKPAISSNLAPQRPHANVSTSIQNQQPTAMTTARPPAQVLESTRPSISAPQIQHQSSTGPTAPSRPQVKIQEHSPSPAPTPAQHAAPPSRPIPARTQFGQSLSQMDTQYVNMLLALDDIPFLHNLLAGFFNWILLAGFILFPGTFTSFQNLNATGVTAQVQHHLVNAVTHIPLFVIAWVCTGIGAIGMIWMSWRWRKNYLWGLNKIFMPGFLNSLAGLLSTLANIFGVQHGQLSTTSKITLIVTSASTGVLGILTAFYTLWLVRRVKRRHDDQVGVEKAGKHGEGVVDVAKRKANGNGGR